MRQCDKTSTKMRMQFVQSSNSRLRRHRYADTDDIWTAATAHEPYFSKRIQQKLEALSWCRRF